MFPQEQNRKVSDVTMITGQCHGYVQVIKSSHLQSQIYMCKLEQSLTLDTLKFM
jgi:hypothetical protein